MNRQDLRSIVSDLKVCEYNYDERRDFIERYNFRNGLKKIGSGVTTSALISLAAACAFTLGYNSSYLVGLPNNSLPIPDSHIGSFGAGLVLGSAFLYFFNPLAEREHIKRVARNLRHRKKHGRDIPGLKGKDLESL